MSSPHSKSNLTEYQRHVIRFSSSNGKTVNEIRDLPELRRSNGSKPQKRTIQYWIQRLNETGDTKRAKKTGRTRKLNKKQEEKLIKFIEENPKIDYLTIASQMRKTGIAFDSMISARTVNDYALRNKIRMFDF